MNFRALTLLHFQRKLLDKENMPAISQMPDANDNPQPGNVFPLLPGESNPQSSTGRKFLAVLLSLYVGLFLINAVASFADASMILFFDLHFLSAICLIISLFAMFSAVLIYLLMGLTPMIPKRLFLPLTLFNLVAMLAVIPLTIYHYDRIPLIGWSVATCQVLFGLGILCCIQGGFNFRWPLVAVNQLNRRRFSWLNLFGFVVANIFVLVPAVIVYVLLNTALAVDHFSAGFVALRPGGILVQVRKYVRDDGKVIELFPMAHVADAGFYQKVSQTFPSNSIILMEGVTDSQNLLTNKISYKRMARSLGLAEQHEDFTPGRGEMVRADIDIDQFSQETIGFLNLVMLIHTQGLNPGIVQQLMFYSPPPNFEERLFDDLLGKRNQHLLGEIQSHLAQSDNLMVPWGAAHMPGIAREIQKSGFHLAQTQEFMVIRFRGFGSPGKVAGKRNGDEKAK